MINQPLRDNITRQPLVEVFGNFVDNCSEEALRARKLKLCPYNNKIPNCNREKLKNPLGVCSFFVEGKPVIICPVRLRQNWRVITDIAEELFPDNAKWTTLPDVHLYDKFNNLIDVIDYVIVAYDRNGNVIDFISIDILGIYTHGNVRQAFDLFNKNSVEYLAKDHHPLVAPDFNTTIQRRLAPQIIYKGSIFNAWGKKAAYVLDKGLFEKLPKFAEEQKQKAEISWFTYELKFDPSINNYKLHQAGIMHTLFEPTLFEITKIEPGPIQAFINQLQQKLDEKIDKSDDSTTETLTDILT